MLAVDHIGFHVDEGETLGLIGPNGAGKTTNFNMIMGELSQDSGGIFFQGEEISKYPTHERVKKGIARTYQVPRPFSETTVRENIRVGMMPDSILQMLTMKASTEREREIAESVGLGADELAKYPSELSMGDLRKLELARTIASEPKLLLLDEVFAGLTTAEIAQLSTLIQEQKKNGLSYIVVSHDLKALAPLVDRVVAISFGAVIAEGSFEEVIANEKVQTAYLGQ
ncbi:MAG: ATP-binding cassette domain-containing protein [Arenicellales bacterium]|nr:ATP-binding cassette domain-containing protein [Arenicellales bacterium]